MDEEALRDVSSVVERARAHAAECAECAETLRADREVPPELEQRLLAAFREWRET